MTFGERFVFRSLFQRRRAFRRTHRMKEESVAAREFEIVDESMSNSAVSESLCVPVSACFWPMVFTANACVAYRGQQPRRELEPLQGQSMSLRGCSARAAPMAIFTSFSLVFILPPSYAH
ncbi:MAG: hypothetical protein M3436_12075 [Pseudomonadota bacterium]|nr:hypothetical protein [Pseudomonadota bacterium]